MVRHLSYLFSLFFAALFLYGYLVWQTPDSPFEFTEFLHAFVYPGGVVGFFWIVSLVSKKNKPHSTLFLTSAAVFAIAVMNYSGGFSFHLSQSNVFLGYCGGDTLCERVQNENFEECTKPNYTPGMPRKPSRDTVVWCLGRHVIGERLKLKCDGNRPCEEALTRNMGGCIATQASPDRWMFSPEMADAVNSCVQELVKLGR